MIAVYIVNCYLLTVEDSSYTQIGGAAGYRTPVRDTIHGCLFTCLSGLMTDGRDRRPLTCFASWFSASARMRGF